jgi:hypothetical protein
MTPSREFLGRDYDPAGRRTVFGLPDALETDEAVLLRIERTRVYFDDILAITHHRQLGFVFLLFNGLFATGLLIGAAASWMSDAPRAAVVTFSILSSPFVLAIILRLALGVDVITVYGRRTSTRFRFAFRKQRARDIFRDLTLKIRARQESIADSVLPPPPVPDLPPPPPPPEIPMPPPPPSPGPA